MSLKLNGILSDDKQNSQMPESRQNPTEWEWWAS